MKLGHDFGRTPFGIHQVQAARDRLRDQPIWRSALERGIFMRRHGFGNATAEAIGTDDLKRRRAA